MTALDISVPFGFGLVSSLHCTQMCGPIVLTYSLASRGSAVSHLLYNAGRLATYTLLGAVAGAAGSVMGVLGQLAGLQRAALLVSGVLMLLAGIVMSGWLPKSGLIQIERLGVSRFFSRFISRLMMSPHPASKLGLGLLMGFLPCGLLYAALINAVSTGDALSGAVAMASFATGTSLALLGIGLFSTAIGARLGRWTTTFATVSVMLMGAFLVWRGMLPTPGPGVNCHGRS